jgi:hypothetical protein
MKKISTCYEATLKANPQIEGKIIYEWVINDIGEVGSVEIVESTVNSIELETCNMEILKAMKYKPLGDGCWAKARYPFVYDIVKNQ